MQALQPFGGTIDELLACLHCPYPRGTLLRCPDRRVSLLRCRHALAELAGGSRLAVEDARAERVGYKLAARRT